MLVKMTDQDIRDGLRLHASGCPVALAVMRSIDSKNRTVVTVRHGKIYVRDLSKTDYGSYYKPSVPQREMVANFIRDFDNNLDVKKLPVFTIRKVRSIEGDIKNVS